jgi:catechol 2,3-dioxygenase-like lactoylglutathione lyase family enzyme
MFYGTGGAADAAPLLAGGDVVTWEDHQVQTHLSHIQFNVRPGNVPFYKDLFAFLGWQAIHEGDGFLGVAGKHGASLWFIGQVKDVNNDYDGPGMNHLALGTERQADVDAAAAYLRERGVALLFDTPRHRPEFSEGEGQTYYQVMFESPDRVLLEVVYTGPKEA